MPIDINLLRAFKGGAPDIVKLSQKNRFKDIAIVDKVISQDEVSFHFYTDSNANRHGGKW